MEVSEWLDREGELGRLPEVAPHSPISDVTVLWNVLRHPSGLRLTPENVLIERVSSSGLG